MAWRAAPAVRAILNQANARWPDRNKSSDGIIGDEAHSARVSDHNPDSDGVVLAADLTHDPAHGVDCQSIFNAIVAARDKRVKYVIFNRRICSTVNSPWVVRAYTGSNAHTGHMHVSVRKAYQDDASAWPGIAIAGAPPGPSLPPPAPPTSHPPTITMGSKDEYWVHMLQVELNSRYGARLKVDNDFGPKTLKAVKRAQRRMWPWNWRMWDGVVGPLTWSRLGY